MLNWAKRVTDDRKPPFNPPPDARPTLDPEIGVSNPSEQRRNIAREIRAGLRPGQDRMADWIAGPLAVSAVPGAGKSTGMAAAAALAIARHQLNPGRQLVVVTFTRSAAGNIRAKIRQDLLKLSEPPVGFVVHTLHGLALYIATSHRELSGLDLENSTLALPSPSHRLIRTCVEQWIGKNPRAYQRLIEGRQFDGEETERLRRRSVLRTEVLPDLAWKTVQEAKSSGFTPEMLRELGDRIPDDYDILTVAAGLYENYQILLQQQQLIDYDEMILGALRVLENDAVRQSWQERVFAVFEDEAQDSTPLQSRLLEILACEPGGNIADLQQLNLVRVGDPNQAINSTFTPADPIYFRQFCETCDGFGRLATMDRAGRSSGIIIDAANFVLRWVNDSQLAGKEQPFREQAIRPVDTDDPQADANPPAVGRGLELYRPHDIYHTVTLIAKRVIELYEGHPEGKFAILVRENRQGEFIANALQNPKEYNLEIDVGKYPISIYDASTSARQSHIPKELLRLLQFIDRPHSPDYLKAALKVLGDRNRIPNQDFNTLAAQPEQFLYPGPLDPPQSDAVRRCRQLCCSLLQARFELPPYQLISFLALSLQYEKSELATADKLAARIAQQSGGNQTLPGILNVLDEIVGSERFEPVEVDEEGRSDESIFTRPGQLTIVTMHKAKGLDWDYVFLPFLHEGILPGSLRVLPQTRFLGEFTLSEVARAQIRANLHDRRPLPDVMTAWEKAGHLKTAEEYRLLYVAMTRAKRLLWMSASALAPFSWHRPDSLQEQRPCPILAPLKKRFPESFILL